MSKDIHLLPELFAPSGWRWGFWISAQLFTISPIKAYSQPIFACFSKALDNGKGKGGREDEVFPFCHKEMPCRMVEIIWVAYLLLFSHSLSVS